MPITFSFTVSDANAQRIGRAFNRRFGSSVSMGGVNGELKRFARDVVLQEEEQEAIDAAREAFIPDDPTVEE